MKSITRLAVALPVLSLFQIAAAIAQQPVGDGWVSLPVTEYRVLRDQANPPGPPEPAPEPTAVITRADYELRVGDSMVTGRGLFTIDVLADGWTSVPLAAGLMASDARLDGQPVSLISGQPPRVILTRAGRSVLTLDIAIPLTASAGAESFVLPASGAPITRVVVTVPRTGVELTVADGFISEHAETASESRWVAFGRAQQPLTVSWKRRVDDQRTDQPLRIRTRISELVALGEDGGQVTASVRVEVVQGLARDFSMQVPSGFIVNQVDGPLVAEWIVSDGVLRVRLLEPAAGDVSFVVRGDSRLPRDGEMTMPLVRVEAAERETGGVVVDVVGAGEIARHQVRGLEPADVSEFADAVSGRESPSMAAFRLSAGAGTAARTLSVHVVRYTPQAVLIANIERARYRALVSEDGRLLMEATYLIRNNHRSFLKVTPPAQSALWSVTVAGRPTRPGVADATGLLVPLDKGRTGEDAPISAVSVVYVQEVPAWDRSGTARIELPAVDLPVSRTDLEFYYSPRYTVEFHPGVFRQTPGATPLDVPTTVAVQRPAAPVPQRVGGSVSALQAVIDRFNNEGGGRAVVGTLPVQIDFPVFGPALYLAAELTAEAQASSIDLSFRRVNR